MSAPKGVSRLHHHAYRCRDSEETRRFYEDILDMKLGIFLRIPHYEAPGDVPPFTHLFFEMNDGSYIAFFDLGDDGVSQYCPDTYEWVNHLALEVDSHDTLLHYKKRLEDAGVAVKGPKNHHFVDSIYFYDPNGIRLELTAWKEDAYFSKADFLKHEAEEAPKRIAAWTAEKQSKRAAAE
jgi:catechol 2,3-dioxygenase-like lactoylglutathione lyase family enzyme